MLEWILLELKQIEVPISRYFSNYHAWDYRLWVIAFVIKQNSLSEEQTVQLLTEEWTFSNNWVSKHVSDYCGYHYRHRLIDLLASHKVWQESVSFKLERELEDNSSRLQLYEGHEALWYYRRAILTKLFLLSPDSVASMKKNEECFISLVMSRKSPKDFSKLNSKLCNNHKLWLSRSFIAIQA